MRALGGSLPRDGAPRVMGRLAPHRAWGAMGRLAPVAFVVLPSLASVPFMVRTFQARWGASRLSFSLYCRAARWSGQLVCAKTSWFGRAFVLTLRLGNPSGMFGRLLGMARSLMYGRLPQRFLKKIPLGPPDPPPGLIGTGTEYSSPQFSLT